MRAPTEQQRALHELTHVPFQSWCVFCQTRKGKDDHHGLEVVTSKSDRSVPIIQSDFMYNRSQEDGEIAVALLMTDEWTRMLRAFPISSKKNIKAMAEEMVRFSLELNYLECVEFVSDSEPTIKAVLDYAKTVRQGMGYNTQVNWGTPYDKSKTAICERSIQTLRRQYATMMSCLESQCEVSIGQEHPIAAWCLRHAAWVLNRYHKHT